VRTCDSISRRSSSVSEPLRWRASPLVVRRGTAARRRRTDRDRWPWRCRAACRRCLGAGRLGRLQERQTRTWRGAHARLDTDGIDLRDALTGRRRREGGQDSLLPTPHAALPASRRSRNAEQAAKVLQLERLQLVRRPARSSTTPYESWSIRRLVSAVLRSCGERERGRQFPAAAATAAPARGIARRDRRKRATGPKWPAWSGPEPPRSQPVARTKPSKELLDLVGQAARCFTAASGMARPATREPPSPACEGLPSACSAPWHQRQPRRPSDVEHRHEEGGG